MTVTSLLGHVGVHVPRGVTIDGRIVLGTPVVGRAVTALEPHTFHAGPGPEFPSEPYPSAEPPQPDDDAWWNLAPSRLEADQAAVRAAFPSFQLIRDNGSHTWQGVLDTGHGRYRIDVAGNRTGGMPFIWPVQPRRLGRHEGARWRPSPHLYTNGGLCVAETTDWIPERHTTATAIAWAAHWLAAYTVWRIGGPWPTEGYRPRVA